MLSKDNLVYGLAGMVLGIIIGVILVSASGPRMSAANPAAMPPPPQEQSAPAAQQGGSGGLPEGHPPVDPEAMNQQIAKQLEVVNKDPENQKEILALANLNFDAKHYDEALKWYEKARNKDPKNVDIITDLGSCYLWLNQSQKAIEYYDQSLAIDPKHFQTLMNLGIARMTMGDRAGAAEVWEKVLTLYPDNPEAQMLRDAVQRLRSKKETS